MPLRERLRAADSDLLQARKDAEEAFAQQTATADILRVISRSATDIQPVLDAVAENAARLCAANDAIIYRVEGLFIRPVARYGPLAVPAELPLSRASVTGRAILDCQTLHIDDAAALSEREFPETLARLHRGHRTFLVAPLAREGTAMGALLIRRTEVRPFTERQIAVLNTFADQAVIAIENVRLFNETREALEQQTATTEILRVISQSPTDTQPVFEAIVRSGLKLFPDSAVAVTLPEGNEVRLAAIANLDPRLAEQWRRTFPVPLTRAYLHGVAMLDRRFVDVPDAKVHEDPALAPGIRNFLAGGYRAITIMPMVRGEAAIGTVTVVRLGPGPLTGKQMALLRTFADQAVIAIENVRLFNETREALERQTATAEILRVISGTPTDTQPVFDAIVQAGLGVFAGTGVAIALADRDRIRVVAAGGKLSQMAKTVDMPLSRESITGTAMTERRVVNVRDTEAPEAPHYGRENGRLLGFRSMAAAPMLRDGVPIGAIAVSLQHPGGLSDAHLELLQTFADQAVIAIENVRLFNETKEALERQTATAEILRVITSSPTDLQPVMATVVESAARLAAADHALIGRIEGGSLRWLAAHGCELPGGARVISRGLPSGRAVLDLQTTQIEDVAEIMGEFPSVETAYRELGVRTIIATPLIHAGSAVGVLLLRRTEVRPFADREIALLKTFADQAAIAVENVRLFNETKEALERQTATAEILKVISSSPTDVQPVFESIAERATVLCGAKFAFVSRFDGELLHLTAFHGVSSEARIAVEQSYPIRRDDDAVAARTVRAKAPVQIADVLAEAEYGYLDTAKKVGWRSILGVPLLRKGGVIGAIVVAREESGLFPAKQVDLLNTFAAQAVIAIENARLFNETTEALDQQKASAEVLGAIGRSIADASPVFEKILESCQRLFEGHQVGLNLIGDDGWVHLPAYQGPKRDEMQGIYPMPLDRTSGTGRSIHERSVIDFPIIDSSAPEYVQRGSRIIGVKSIVFAPLLAEGKGIGALWVGRLAAGAFGEKQTALLQTFANQAVIAIQNARLFQEIQEKSRQLEIANKHKSEFLANMSHELRTPLNAIIGFTRIVMRRSKEQLEAKQYENLEKILSSGQNLLALINAILDLSKVEAGHVEVNAAETSLAPVLEQCLRIVEPLVKPDAVALVKEFDGVLPQMYVDEEKLRQIVINLLSNAAKFTARGAIRVRARAQNGSVDIAVADSGIGIAADKIERIFEEFEQADASSTRIYGGTGLGLTIARRLARLMGGDIRAESTLGSGSTFTLTLPTRYGAGQ